MIPRTEEMLRGLVPVQGEVCDKAMHVMRMVSDLLSAANYVHRVYLTGGAVRRMRSPLMPESKDFDIIVYCPEYDYDELREQFLEGLGVESTHYKQYEDCPVFSWDACTKLCLNGFDVDLLFTSKPLHEQLASFDCNLNQSVMDYSGRIWAHPDAADWTQFRINRWTAQRECLHRMLDIWVDYTEKQQVCVIE